MSTEGSRDSHLSREGGSGGRCTHAAPRPQTARDTGRQAEMSPGCRANLSRAEGPANQQQAGFRGIPKAGRPAAV